MGKRLLSIGLSTALILGGAGIVAAPAQARMLQWVTMKPTQAQCNEAVKWKMYEFHLKQITVIGTSPCRSTHLGWEGAIQYR